MKGRLSPEITLHCLDRTTAKASKHSDGPRDEHHQHVRKTIRLRTATIGSLCVFAAHDQGHDDRDVVVIQMLADAASAALVHQRDQGRMQTLDEQIRDALDARITLEQAKGALSHHRGVGIDEAFQMLRTRARSAGRGLLELANDVIYRGERLDGLL